MRKRVKFAAGARTHYMAETDETTGRYMGSFQLECRVVLRNEISHLPLLAEFTQDPERPGMLVVKRAPVSLHCGRETFGLFNRDCYDKHHWIEARYPLWHQLGRNVLVCAPRMEAWNGTGRFQDSRNWVGVYVYLLSRGVVSSDLRSLFRQWARFLMWPRYEAVESQEDSQKAPDNRSETDT